jgi:hypothetical protein
MAFEYRHFHGQTCHQQFTLTNRNFPGNEKMISRPVLSKLTTTKNAYQNSKISKVLLQTYKYKNTILPALRNIFSGGSWCAQTFKHRVYM